MTSPSSAHCGSCNLPKKVLSALLACAAAFLASCTYPSAYTQSGYQGYTYPAQSNGYGYTQPATTAYTPAQNYTVRNNPITNNRVTNTAAAWARRVPMQSANPTYPTANSNPTARGRRIVPNAQTVANRGVFGGPARQPVYNTQPVATQPVATQPVAMQPVATQPANTWNQTSPAPTYAPAPAYTPAPTPAAANSWQGAPNYPPAPAGYGPMNQTQSAGVSNVNYTGNAAAYTTPGVAGTSTYTIQRGDSLSAIAQRHQVPLASLLQVNGLTMQSVIHPNNVLTIPGR